MGLTEKEKLSAFLFDREDRKVVNIKFFRGPRDLVSTEELCAQVHSAFMQKRMGKARVTDWLEPSVTKVNVEQFIATL